jgi:pyruvate/2-oxoglutarate/acetoin dehydrogenase E1 component
MEKLFFGVEGLSIFSLSPYFPVERAMQCVLCHTDPTIVVEGKQDYSRKVTFNDQLLSGIFAVRYKVLNDNLYFIASATNFESDAYSVITYGPTIHHALDAVARIAVENECFGNVICPLKISPLDLTMVLDDISNHTLFVCEENSTSFGFGSECIAHLSELHWRGKGIRIGNKGKVIPNARILEEEMLISVEKIFLSISEVMLP